VPATAAVSAVLATSTGTLVVTFNGALQPGTSNGAQWTARVSGVPGNWWNGSSGSPAIVAGNLVTVHLTIDGQQFNPTLARYTPAPGDLFGSTGLPIPSQQSIPMTVV
jgi:hypothetical protein